MQKKRRGSKNKLCEKRCSVKSALLKIFFHNFYLFKLFISLIKFIFADNSIYD